MGKYWVTTEMLSKGQGYITQKEISAESENEGVAAQLPTFYSIKSSLYRSRREHLPPTLRTRADLDLSGEWCKTASGEKFVNDGDDDKIVIFGTENALQHLSEADTFFVDGTFFFVTVA